MKPEDSGRFDRALLEDALPAAEPPAGFADRVIGGIDAQPARKPWPMALSAAGGVAATVLLFFALGNHHTLGGAGRVDVGAREEVALGGRGIAVAEEGSAFEWRVGKDGAARVDQQQGNVFYRVERGEPFIVQTPAGEVQVKGTCFRVEVMPMSLKHALVGATAGAALATVVVTVYEGRVAVRNAHGATEIGAGGRVGITSDNAPSAALAVAGDPQKAAQLAGAPPDNATRDDLLTRDAVHRQQIAALENQVKELSKVRVTAGPQEKHGGPHEKKFSGLTKDELVDMAKNCEIRADLPNFGGADTDRFNPEDVSRNGFSQSDIDAYNKVVADEKQKFSAAMHSIYQEVIGDRGDNLELRTLMDEVEGKIGRKDMSDARTRVSQERAGLVPPLDPSQQTPGYKLLKLLTSEGDQIEQALAQQVGPDKARLMRDAGASSRMIMNGCDKK
jgi:hypothetical protein